MELNIEMAERSDEFPVSHYDVNDLYNTYVTGARVGYWAAVERTSEWIYSQSVDDGIVLKSEEDIRKFIENYKERMKNKIKDK